MPARSPKLASLSESERKELERRLLDRQSGLCFIDEEPIDLVLHAGQLDIDHIVPLDANGPDEENNFALVHVHCNRSKGTSDLRVARRMAQFEKLQELAKERGDRGANLGHLLARFGGAKSVLRIRYSDGKVEFSLAEAGDNRIQSVPVYRDQLSGMDYFFAVFPLQYLHHDDRINPRPIGANIRGLIEEFVKKYPQLHVALGWWAAGEDGTGKLKVFDGQHKAAAQILLGVKELPVRVFINPDTDKLLETNTHAGGPLRQVAFDTAVMHHLGSTLYAERVRQYQQMKGLCDTEYTFSERDLVTFFKGEHRDILRYILDATRDNISHNKESKLMEFVEWSGKSADRPLAYSTIERTFFREFLYKKPLENPIDEGLASGDNPRMLERVQMVRLMNIFAEVFFVGQWDLELGGSKLEDRLRKGDPISEGHLRAWRISREEVLANVLKWVRTVVLNYYAYMGKPPNEERLLHQRFQEQLWKRIELFLRHLAALPCWVDKGLSSVVFGAKQNLDFWHRVFETGVAPSGVRILAQPLDLIRMVQENAAVRSAK
jgi:hypothetical protein